jgi:hypothetical protein
MVYGWGFGIIDKFNILMTLAKFMFFYLPLSRMKCNEVPFTNIHEWNKSSPSSTSSDSSGWIFVVPIVTLGPASIIHFPLSYFE